MSNGILIWCNLDMGERDQRRSACLAGSPILRSSRAALTPPYAGVLWMKVRRLQGAAWAMAQR